MNRKIALRASLKVRIKILMRMMIKIKKFQKVTKLLPVIKNRNEKPIITSNNINLLNPICPVWVLDFNELSRFFLLSMPGEFLLTMKKLRMENINF